MNRNSKTTSLSVKATRQVKYKHLDYLKKNLVWVISFQLVPFTMNQFFDLMALLGMAYFLQIFVEWANPYIRKIYESLKKLFRHDKDN
jgi:hypothetical protein